MKPQSISFSANPTYRSVSNLMFCGPLVFQLIPATGNPKSRFHELPASAFHRFLPARQRILDSMTSTGSQKQRSYRYTIANHEETSRLAYLFCSTAAVWIVTPGSDARGYRGLRPL